MSIPFHSCPKCYDNCHKKTPCFMCRKCALMLREITLPIYDCPLDTEHQWWLNSETKQFEDLQNKGCGK